MPCFIRLATQSGRSKDHWATWIWAPKVKFLSLSFLASRGLQLLLARIPSLHLHSGTASSNLSLSLISAFPTRSPTFSPLCHHVYSRFWGLDVDIFVEGLTFSLSQTLCELSWDLFGDYEKLRGNIDGTDQMRGWVGSGKGHREGARAEGMKKPQADKLSSVLQGSSTA